MRENKKGTICCTRWGAGKLYRSFVEKLPRKPSFEAEKDMQVVCEAVNRIDVTKNHIQWQVSG
jgi:hypothetical protein